MYYAHHQNELNEGIKMMCFICRFNVYLSCKQRKCSQNFIYFKIQIVISNNNNVFKNHS